MSPHAIALLSSAPCSCCWSPWPRVILVTVLYPGCAPGPSSRTTLTTARFESATNRCCSEFRTSPLWSASAKRVPGMDVLASASIALWICSFNPAFVFDDDGVAARRGCAAGRAAVLVVTLSHFWHRADVPVVKGGGRSGEDDARRLPLPFPLHLIYNSSTPLTLLDVLHRSALLSLVDPPLELIALLEHAPPLLPR